MLRDQRGCRRLVLFPGSGNQPALTVITPCLNAANTIADTLQSISLVAGLLRKQGMALEHLVIDGGSRDGTLDLLNEYRLHNGFCRVFRGVGGGPYVAMNLGLATAKGYFTHVLNADDLICAPTEYVALLQKGLAQGFEFLLGSIVYFRRPDWRVRSCWKLDPLPLTLECWRRELKQGVHYPHPGFIACTQHYQKEQFDLRYSLSADYKMMQALLLQIDSINKVCASPKIIVAMAEGGLTSGWRSILNGHFQLRRINRELGIHSPAWRRYFAKAIKRYVTRENPGFTSEFHQG